MRLKIFLNLDVDSVSCCFNLLVFFKISIDLLLLPYYGIERISIDKGISGGHRFGYIFGSTIWLPLGNVSKGISSLYAGMHVQVSCFMLF